MSNSISNYKFPSISFDQSSKLVFIAGGIALALWSFYHPRGDRQMQIQNSDKSSNDGAGNDNFRQNDREVSNQSWLLKENKKWGTKFDLMHKGKGKGGKLVIVMVGIPNRGKTYISRKVARYLRWISYRARVFSLAKYRLDKLGSKPAVFFNPSNSENTKLRDDLMMTAMEDLIRYLNGGGEIAILDGTNCTKDRRRRIRERVALEDGYEILWIECLKKDSTDDTTTAPTSSSSGSSSLKEDVTADLPDYLKDSPDYMDKEDFLMKIAYYEKIYEPLRDDEGCSVRIYGSGLDLKLHQIHGYLRTKVASFLMNLHTTPRPVYMTRHGESVFNVKGLIGGDSGLSHRGQQFAAALCGFIENNESAHLSLDTLCVWTSTMRRTKETAAGIKCKRLVEWRALREIEVGVCDGLSYDQVKSQFPEEFRARDHDKLRYRYPRGESYMDVINRLEPVIFELERQTEPLIIVGHQAVLRCLYAYFFDLPAEEIPYLSIPLHTLIKLEPRIIGCQEKRMRIIVEDDKIGMKNEVELTKGVGAGARVGTGRAGASAGAAALQRQNHGPLGQQRKAHPMK